MKNVFSLALILILVLLTMHVTAEQSEQNGVNQPSLNAIISTSTEEVAAGDEQTTVETLNQDMVNEEMMDKYIEESESVMKDEEAAGGKVVTLEEIPLEDEVK